MIWGAKIGQVTLYFFSRAEQLCLEMNAYRRTFHRGKSIEKYIHRMQIWRTTRSSPGTSHESEASEVSVFCFDNASPEKVLLRGRASLFYFAMPTSF